VVVDGEDIHGDGVNVAARLEALCEPGGIAISGNTHEQVQGKLEAHFEDTGEHAVKNITRPIRVWKWTETTTKEMRAIPEAAEPLSLPDKPSIAVLAFDDLSTGSDRDYLSDAIGEGIITELSRFSELFVIARNSSFKYRDKATDVREIAAELGVHYVLEGSQQKHGDRLRVTVQLIDALAGNHIWSERYDRDLVDIFAVQDEIVRSVASTAGAKIAFKPPPTGGLKRLSALHHHLRARQHIRQFTKENTEQARLENLAAIEADPTSPFGYIGLTFVYINLYRYGWSDLGSDEILACARKWAEKALELEPNNYDSHYAMAKLHSQTGEQDLSIARHEKSIELNPGATNVMASLAETLLYTGRVGEAIELLHRAMRLDPHHPDWFKWNLAETLWTAEDCDTALSTMLSMAKIPNMARLTLAVIFVCLGRQEEAKATIGEFLQSEPDYSIAEVKDKTQHLYKDPAIRDRWIADLRTAGLPE
jgi:adenylate cyclase